jgi:hypothetical protein
MSTADRPIMSGDLCPECHGGHVEIGSSPTPKDGRDFRTRYLRCSRRELGCKFKAKQVVSESEVRRRIS